jgi:hypothetical protein
MDASAFASVATSLFADGPSVPPTEAEDTQHNHAQMVYEGERRKALMLKVADGLEERYRTLLNPDALKAYENAVNGSAATKEESSGEQAFEEEEEEEGEGGIEGIDGEVEEEEEERPPQSPSPVDISTTQNARLRIRLPARSSLPSSTAGTPKPPSSSRKKHPPRPALSPTVMSTTTPPASTRKSLRHKTGQFLNGDEPYFESTTSHQPALATPPTKRIRRASVTSQGSSSTRVSTPPHSERDWRKSELYIAAQRSAPALSRKPARHQMAFGSKMPEMPEMEFEIPRWAQLNIGVDELATGDDGDVNGYNAAIAENGVSWYYPVFFFHYSHPALLPHLFPSSLWFLVGIIIIQLFCER